MSAQLTRLLAVLLIAAGASASLAWTRLEKRRHDAIAGERDLASCLHDLAEMSGAGSASDMPASADDPELNRRLRSAATVAGASDEIASIEPGQPKRLRDSDYTETLVFVRLNAVTLQQLITFLHTLSAHDPGVRARSIELAPPGAPNDERVNNNSIRPGKSGEFWTADVALAYVVYAPNAAAKPPASN